MKIILTQTYIFSSGKWKSKTDVIPVALKCLSSYDLESQVLQVFMVLNRFKV